MKGRRLADRYELVERRGSGGMAEVWEAIDHNLGRRVAVKILHGHLAADTTILNRFRSEAQAAARLTHPGIVAIYDTVTVADTDAIIMELVAGRDLRTILDERPTLAMSDAVEVGLQLSAALGHAHQHGIIHRDIKPANILVRPDRRVKLSDFGIAKALDGTSHTESGSLVGTVKYLAPEQIEGHPVDARTDLYGLTTVLYEMLCGEVPFSANDLIGAMNRIRKNPPSARKLRPDLPPSLDAFLTTGLARKPSERYPDAATWSEQLKMAVNGNESASRPAVGDRTVVEGPAARAQSIPIRPAPGPSRAPGPRPAAAQAPSATSGVQPVPRAAASIPPSDEPIVQPLAKHVKPKRRTMAWLGPLIALGLAVATVVTVYLLLRPASTAVTDRLGDETSEVDNGAEPTDDSTVEDASDESSDVITDAADESAIPEAQPTPDTAQSDDSEGQIPEDSTTTSTTTTLPAFVDGLRAVAFDPLGDNEEHNEAASRPFDGDPTTFWLTQQYKTRAFGQLKEGVGLVIELESPRDLTELRVLANRVDWAVSIYEADAPSPALDGWQQPLASFTGLPEQAVLDIPDTPSVASLLFWVTDLGLSPEQSLEEYEALLETDEIAQQLQIFELELIG